MTGSPLTKLLRAAGAGEAGARDKLLEHVYQDLIVVARREFRREGAGHTLQPTALVSEAWMRLDGHEDVFQSRAQFFSAAAKAMRRILIDHARRNNAEKRGGGNVRETLMDVAFLDDAIDVIEVDDALTALAAEDEDLAKIVELRFFAGLTIEEVAQLQGVATATVKRRWTFARAWLYERMGESD